MKETKVYCPFSPEKKLCTCKGKERASAATAMAYTRSLMMTPEEIEVEEVNLNPEQLKAIKRVHSRIDENYLLRKVVWDCANVGKLEKIKFYLSPPQIELPDIQNTFAEGE